MNPPYVTGINRLPRILSDPEKNLLICKRCRRPHELDEHLLLAHRKIGITINSGNKEERPVKIVERCVDCVELTDYEVKSLLLSRPEHAPVPTTAAPSTTTQPAAEEKPIAFLEGQPVHETDHKLIFAHMVRRTPGGTEEMN